MERSARVCAVAAAARAGEAVPSWVSGGGGGPVTRAEGGARPAGRRHAAQSPRGARRGRGETYTGPPGPAQRRRRGLRTAPPPPGALGTAPRFAPSYFGSLWGGRGRQPQEGSSVRIARGRRGGLRACGPGQSEDPPFPPPPRCFRAGAGSGVTERPAPPASWSWGSGRGALEETSCFANLQEKFGSPCLRAGPPPRLRRSPSAAAAGGDTRPRAESRGPLARAFLGRERVHRGAQRAEVTHQPAGRSWDAETRGAMPTNPAVRLGRANDPSQMNPSNSRTGRCQVSDRLPGARPSPPAAGPRALGGALRSVPATPTASTPSPATCRDASISWKRQRRRGKKKKKRESERTSAWHLPDDYIRKTSSSSSSGSSFPPRVQQQRGCENHQENPQTFARRENKLECSSGGTSSPGGIATTGEEWEGAKKKSSVLRRNVQANHQGKNIDTSKN
ncbi:hypothetical protein AB1E18_005263 [Capra hircus]